MKEALTIAVSTNDRRTVFPHMLGQAKGFSVYRLAANGCWQLLEWRSNPYEKTLQHEKTLDVYELIKDCRLILAAKIGRQGRQRLRQKGVRLFFAKGQISAALEAIKQEL